MKALFARIFAALFALGCVSSYAAVPAAGNAIYNSDDKKDEVKSPPIDTDRKSEDDKKPKDEDKDKKS